MGQKKRTGGGFGALATVILESRLEVLRAVPFDIHEPYCKPTSKASKALKAELERAGNEWLIPGPRNSTEDDELDAYLERYGVRFPSATLFEKGDADRDLSPYVMAWRVERGDVLLTHHGLAQFASKPPFTEAAP